MAGYFAPADFRDPSKWDVIAALPRAITPAIIEFCKSLLAVIPEGDLPAVPQFVPIRSPYGRNMIAQCYDCVLDHVSRHGGAPIHGWTIWEIPGVYLVAEHHAVVRTDTGLLDVTPPFTNDKQCLFAPCRYEPERNKGGTLCKLHALSPHSMVQEFVRLKARLNQMLLQSLAHTTAYKMLDDQACRLLMRYQKIMEKRKEQRKKKKRRR